MSTHDRNKNRYFIGRAIIVTLLIFLMNGVAGAAFNTYYWQPSSGAIGSSGFTANWGSCGAQPSSYRVTTLNSAGFNCQSDRVTTSGTGNVVLAIYPTKYNTETQVTGRPGATFYLRERSGSGSVTYRFELGYAKAGAFTSFGYVSQIVPSGHEQSYTINMSSIAGTAPVDSYPALRISTTSSSGEQRAYFGSNGGTTGSNSGRFSVDEIAAPSNPTYNVTVKSVPTSAGVIAGGNYVYTIIVNNTGNTNGNYTLSVTDSDTTNFLNSVPGTTTLSVPAAGSNQTTLTVTARGTASNGAADTTTVTATSVENTNYTNSTQVTTTVQAAAPSVSVSLVPSAQDVQAGDQVQYNITVQNTGNVADSYTLSLNNSNTADFTYMPASTATGSLAPGAQYVTTMTVTATAGATPGNSHAQTVRATGNATNTSNTVTTTVAAAGPSKVIVRTNRQIVLDDPNSNLIGSSTWSSNYWSGETTTIRAYALALDSKGRAISNHPITFSINGITGSSLTVNTNANGIASYSYQLNDASNNGAKAPGNYTIIANASTVSSRINFTYSYFGCSRCHNDKGLDGVTSRNLNPKSPYITTYNQIHAQTTNKHNGGKAQTQLEGNQCNYCHTAYGTGTSTVNNPSTIGTDVHSTTQKCSNCHDSGTGFFDSAAIIKDCAACHSSYNNKVTSYPSASFWTGGMIKYSSQPMVAHQATPAIPCILCHSPMHNVSTPDTIKSLNTYTEDNECTSCHASQGKHSTSDPVYCTACHSQDAHVIGVMNKTSATQPAFVSVGSANAITASDCIDCHAPGPEATYFAGLTGMTGYGYTTNYVTAAPIHNNHNGTVACTVCHDNSDLHNIKYLTTSGAYSTSNASAVTCIDCHSGQNPAVRDTVNSKLGRFPPVVNTPANHSTDMAGIHWGTYWTDANGACLYCHGDNRHNSTRLGDVSVAVGSDAIGGDIGTGTVCSSCHNPGDSDYTATMAVLDPDPVANQPGSANWNASGVDHSSYGATDADCKACHGGVLSVSASISEFLHNVDKGKSGGPSCISCHYTGSSNHNIDTVSANASAHFGMNSNNATGAGLAAINGACWACHDTDGNVTNNPSDRIMGDIYNTPKKCDDCHLASGTYYPQASGWGAPTVSEHYYSGDQIKAGNSDSNIASCSNCHENVSEMILSNSDTDYGSFAGDGVRLTGGNMSFYHYGKPRQDLRTWDAGQAANCSYCHQNTDTAFTTGMTDPGSNSSIQNHSQTQASPGCYNSTCHSSGWIHNSTLTRPALTEGSTATFCQNCHTTKQTHNGTLDCSNCHIDQSSGDTIHPIKFIQSTGTFDTSRTQTASCTNCHQGAGISGLNAPKIPEPVNHSTSPSAGQKWGNYWDNTSQITACYYCHQNEIHKVNADLLGNVSTVKGTNTFNNADLVNSTWCANCHYAGAREYKGMFLPVPPPEITDASLVASDGTMFFNHSGLLNFNDSSCKSCHGSALSGYSETSLNLSHSVSVGGGDNCINCHGTNYIGASPSVSQTFVNISAFNESIHQDINNTQPATLDNLDCWSCHYNKDMDRQNVKKCGDCHRKPSQWHGNADITMNLSELW